MGQMIVDKVVALLKAGGIRAEAAFPSGKITRITEPVAAVSLQKSRSQEKTAVVLVEILAPRDSGGYLCQKKALEACALLEAGGGSCEQGNCDFLRHGDVLRVPVHVTFRAVARANTTENLPSPTIVAGALTLSYACEFSAFQKRENAEAGLNAAPWEFTVEEFFPWGVWDTLEVEEPFMLDLRCMGTVERYEGCTWTYRERSKEELGIRQIRKGKATGRIVTAET